MKEPIRILSHFDIVMKEPPRYVADSARTTGDFSLSQFIGLNRDLSISISVEYDEQRSRVMKKWDLCMQGS
jgi:hypothetical protein